LESDPASNSLRFYSLFESFLSFYLSYILLKYPSTYIES
jgi:hypothetical protein